MDSKIKNENLKGHRLISVSFLSFILMLILYFQTTSISAQNAQYDINDPRNPDCPCHKRQKLAEEEYKQLKNSNNYSGDEKRSVSDIKKRIKVDEIREKKKTKFYFTDKKKTGKAGCMKRLKFRFERKLKQTKKGRTEYSVCYKW